VKSKRADAARLAIISPYAANVQLVGQMVKQPEYSALRAMPPASTVDGYQGREADIVVVVVGTTSASGPGFTSDAQRLNVMFTRQRCGLVIVGDLNVCGPVDRPNFRKRSR
jgi:superfamily I DNA and/or RNA helicase